MQISRIGIIAVVAILLFGCTSKEEKVAKELQYFHSQVQQNVDRLQHHLDAGRIRNAKILEQYAKVVKKQKPEFAEIVDALSADATTKGPMFQNLKHRLADAKEQLNSAAKSNSQTQSLIGEYNAIQAAATPNNYNMALTDPINVLADMSDGKLSPVTDMSKEAAKAANAARPGSELVGNPNYGQWRQNSSGRTVWEWFGMYAMFNMMFDRPYYYSSWASHRPPSYYHDWGRDYYSSPRQKRQYQQTETRVKKQFASQGKRFNSPYAKSSTGGGKTSSVSAPGKFSSTYSKSAKSAPSSKKFVSSYNSRSSGSGSRSFGSGGK